MMKSNNHSVKFDGKDVPWSELGAALKEYFGFNFSLQYPVHAQLPLEEFCQFYFRSDELSNLKRSERINRAYNDAISSGIQQYVMPTPEGFSSLDEFLDERKKIFEEYTAKVTFTKFYAETYMRSKKSATALLEKHKPSYGLYLYRIRKKYPQLAEFIKKQVDAYNHS